MKKTVIDFLEKKYGSLDCFPEQNLRIDEYEFANDKMELKNVKVVGNDDCFDGDEFYQYALSGDKLYKAYFDLAKDDDGEILELDMVDYGHAYRIEDITDTVNDF